MVKVMLDISDELASKGSNVREHFPGRVSHKNGSKCDYTRKRLRVHFLAYPQ